MTAPARCAAHPSRPAVDTCPTCGQPRCGVDAQGTDCPLCAGRATPTPSVRPVVPPAQQVLRALLASAVVAFLASYVCAEYVEAGLLQYVVSVVTGVLCGGAGLAAARSRGDGQVGAGLRGLTSVVAALGVAHGFHLEGSQEPLSGGVLPFYALAVLGALLWTQPPRRRTPA